MICFMDTTYCVSPHCKNDCGRQLTKEIENAAEKWWGKKGAPIAMGYFCGESENAE